MEGSANGYILIDPEGVEHRAYWAAPYFVVGCDREWDALGNEVSREWSVCHCDDLDHAQSRARLIDCARILDANFEEVQRCPSPQ